MYIYILDIYVCNAHTYMRAYVDEIEALSITELSHLRQDYVDIIILRNTVVRYFCIYYSSNVTTAINGYKLFASVTGFSSLSLFVFFLFSRFERR